MYPRFAPGVRLARLVKQVNIFDRNCIKESATCLHEKLLSLQNCGWVNPSEEFWRDIITSTLTQLDKLKVVVYA